MQVSGSLLLVRHHTHGAIILHIDLENFDLCQIVNAELAG